MSEFWGDMRFGLRLLARSPIFAVTVTLLLGIGIGANTLIFGILDTFLLRSLPVKHPERLVRLIEVHPTGFVTWDLPYALYEQLASNSAMLTDVLCQGDLDVAFEEGASTERIRINAVSPSFFSALGIGAHLGRVLTPGDAGMMHAVISYDFWRRRFGGSTSIIGRTIRLNGRALTVVGVLPRGVNGLTVETTPDARVPLSAVRLLVAQTSKDPFGSLSLQFQIFGWLRPGVALERAEAEIEPRLRAVYEETLIRAYPEFAKRRQNVFDSRLRLELAGHGISSVRAQFSHGLKLLMTSVGLLLLMACGNVACLLLARSAARSQEIGMRLALGANRWRVARQLLTESVVLAVLGGVLGVLLTYVCRPLLLAAIPPIRDRAAVLQPLAVHVDIDPGVLGFAISASLLTALLFGLAPALRGAREDLTGAVRGNRTTTTRLAGQNILVAMQVALCVLLLAGSSVLIETFEHMRSMNPGFDSDHVITFTIDPGLKGYKPDRAKLFSQQLLEKTRSLPGVVAGAIASRAVMRGTGVKATFGAAGLPISRNDFLNSSINQITPGYFDAMGMRILLGRDFTWFEDSKLKPQKVIVNDAFVRRFFPGQNALGKLFGYRGPDGLAMPQEQVIGVVSDAKYRSLREPIPPTVYGAVVNGFDSEFILHLRAAGSPASLIAPVREVMRSLDPELPFIEVSTLRDEVEASLWQERLLAWLSSIFSCFAALLAGLGLYGALDFAVRGRTREVGVRVALGAGPLRVVRLLSRETTLLVVMGAATGIAFYIASARWIRQVLYGVASTDPKALAAAVLFVLAVALLAVAPPILRALRIDPASALRHE